MTKLIARILILTLVSSIAVTAVAPAAYAGDLGRGASRPGAAHC